MNRVLIIDDDQSMCHALSRAVQRIGCEAICEKTLASGLERALRQTLDIVFLDVRLPDGDGLSILPQLMAQELPPAVIIITGKGDPDGAELAIGNGAWDYIEKTHSIQQIMLTLNRALDYQSKRKECRTAGGVKALRREQIIGKSPALQKALDLVASCAQSSSNVLISGETGTGKELFARAIHENSLRAKGPFIIVDCAALPDNLAESIILGYRKGAFTGADQDRAGLVLLADGGTLFLDEIGELPLNLQKVFLRVLQERTVRCVGGKEELKVDFRLVAATNRDLAAMVEAGTFRQDLYFRIQAIAIHLPPVRERAQDIRALANHFIERFCQRAGIPQKGACVEFFETLEAHSWPGNVRELIHTMEHALTAAALDSYLLAQHLPTALRAKVARGRVAPVAPSRARVIEEIGIPVDGVPAFQTFREDAYGSIEQKYLQQLMQMAGNDVKEAIRISGLSQSRFYALLKKHGIPTRMDEQAL